MRRRARRESAPPDIDVTAFLNLMVVLIPFLLLSAAFTQFSVLDLYLPSASDPNQDEQKEEDQRPLLEVLLLDDALLLNDKKSAPIATIPHLATGFDIPALQRALLPIKQRYPDMTGITVLAQPDTAYRQIILVMDGVRALMIQQDGGESLRELFPDIAIGDVPKVASP